MYSITSPPRHSFNSTDRDTSDTIDTCLSMDQAEEQPLLRNIHQTALSTVLHCPEERIRHVSSIFPITVRVSQTPGPRMGIARSNDSLLLKTLFFSNVIFTQPDGIREEDRELWPIAGQHYRLHRVTGSTAGTANATLVVAKTAERATRRAALTPSIVTSQRVEQDKALDDPQEPKRRNSLESFICPESPSLL